jgi:type I restriction enzyme S subunit
LEADRQRLAQLHEQMVTRDDIESLQVPLPPLAEQKRIAAIAQKADRLRRTRRYVLQLSDTYLRSVFLEMFGDPVTNPKGWQTGQLNELCDKVIDCPHSTPIYALDETPYACIRSSDIQKGYLDWSTTKYVDYDEYVKRVARSIPLPSDVIYCREGARFGNAAKIPTGKKVCLGQRMMLFRADFKVATPEFIWGFLNCERTYQQAVRRVGGTASPHVNVEDIKAFATIIPPLPLQEKFAQIVQKFERLRTQQWEGDRQAEHLFQTLLHRGFRGELTPQHAKDDPASVLLEEIGVEQAQAEAEAKDATQAMDDAAEYLGTKAKQQDTEPIQLTLPGLE